MSRKSDTGQVRRTKQRTKSIASRGYFDRSKAKKCPRIAGSA